jgi:uncharacterized protein with WD repeat
MENQLWDLRSNTDGTVQFTRQETSIHYDNVLAAAFSPNDTRLLARVAQDGAVRLWHVGSRDKETLIVQKVGAIAFSPDGRWLATGNKDGTVSMWPIVYGEESIRLQHGDTVHSIAFSLKDRWLATASADGMVRVFAVGTWRELARIKDDGEATGVVFSPDSRWLVTKSASVKPVRVFESATWRELKRLEQEGDYIDVDFSPDGKWLVTRSKNTVRLFETGTWHAKHLFDHNSYVTIVSFSPDGRRLATWTKRGRVPKGELRVWDITTGDEITILSEGQAFCDRSHAARYTRWRGTSGKHLPLTAVRLAGLAVTSFNVFLSGLFASRADCPWQIVPEACSVPRRQG